LSVASVVKSVMSDILDEAIGVKQPRTTSSFSNASNVSVQLSEKLMTDRKPHGLFIQLNELRHEHNEVEWREVARWIKYEEDVEEGADRWGRPHVSSLCFQALLNLRRCLETGTIIMDLNEHELTRVIYRVVEQVMLSLNQNCVLIIPSIVDVCRRFHSI